MATRAIREGGRKPKKTNLPAGRHGPAGWERKGESSKPLRALSQNGRRTIPFPQNSPDAGPDIFPSD